MNEEILCEENGYQLIVEQVERFSDSEDEVEVLELELVEDALEENEIIIEEENLSEILKRFIKSYCKNEKMEKEEKLELNQWLKSQLSEEFPEKEESELKTIAQELIASVEDTGKQYKKIEEYSKSGIKASDYLGNIIEDKIIQEENPKEKLREISAQLIEKNIRSTYRVAAISSSEIVAGLQAFSKMDKYFTRINETIVRGNEQMAKSLITKNATINQNKNLDGFIFEHMHANEFNIDAAVKDIKGVVAEVLVPKPGSSYGKNSVDLVIKVKNTVTGAYKIVRKFQAKLSSSGEKAKALYDKGNYYWQGKLFAKGQESHGNTKIGYNGVESKGISKESAKKIQKEVQSGNLEAANKTFKKDVDTKILSKQLGRQTVMSAGMGMALGSALSLVSKVANGETIEVKDVIVDGLKAGGTVGISTAIAGGLKTAVEKGVIKGLGAKLLSNNVIGAIAVSSISLISTFMAIGSGDLSLKDGVKECGKIFCSTYSGIVVSGASVSIAVGLLTVGSILAPVVGIVAGTIGFFVGNSVASTIYEGATAVVGSICEGAKSIVSTGVELVGAVCSGVVSVGKAFVSGVFSFVSSWFD